MQGAQVPTTGTGHAYAAVETLQICDASQLRHKLFPYSSLFQQFFHRIQAASDRLQPDQGITEPLLQTPGTHGSGGSVQASEQGTVFLPFGHGGGNFQIAAGCGIQGQVFGMLVDPDFPYMWNGGFSILPQIVQCCAGCNHSPRHLFKTQGFGGRCSELFAHQ